MYVLAALYVKHSTHGAYIEYDMLNNLSMHNSTTSQVLKMYSLWVHFEHFCILKLSTVLNIGAVRWVFFLLTLSVSRFQCTHPFIFL